MQNLHNYQNNFRFKAATLFIAVMFTTMITDPGIAQLHSFDSMIKANEQRNGRTNDELRFAADNKIGELLLTEPCFDRWDDRFSLEVSSNIDGSTIAPDGAGGIYLGGGFSSIEGTPARHIARWDGTSWSALGTGPDTPVNLITVSGTDVYVAGGQTVSKWDGSAWTTLGSGLESQVRSIAVSDSDVYAAGGEVDYKCGDEFCTEIRAYGWVVRWNGAGWSSVGSQMNRPVKAIALLGSDLYAGGEFTTAGGTNANRIAKWNGTSWTALGAGAGMATWESVNTIAISGSDVYIGGNFSTAGGNSANNIAKWDGTDWSPLGAGMSGGVSAISVSGNIVYAGGDFVSAGGIPARNLARWDGNSWSSVGSFEKRGRVLALALSGTNVYAAGAYYGSLEPAYLVEWDGSNWSDLVLPRVRGHGMNGWINSLTVHGTDLYAGGIFTRAGDAVANHIARWDGTRWWPLGSGVSGNPALTQVVAIAVSGSDVYAGGLFTTAGGVPASNIAKWNGSSWSALGSGMNGRVQSLVISGSNLYAAGEFTTAGGVPAFNLARWNGSSWSALGSGINGSWVQALAVMGTDVYVGGAFGSAGGIQAVSVAKWNGSSWTSWPGSDIGFSIGWVRDLEVSGNDLYAMGFHGIAKWNGTSWTTIASNLNNNVNGIAAAGTDLFAAGYFNSINGVPANHIARWNGSFWSPLDAGIPGNQFDPYVGPLATSGGDLYMGGSFGTAGCRASRNFARYSFQDLQGVEVSISGRVTTENARGLANAVVSLVNQSGVRRTARTNSFGYYSFNEIPGDAYMISAKSKTYEFQPRTILADADRSAIDFIGLN